MVKKRELHTCKCYDCQHAVLQQWDNNPIVAYCNKTGIRDTAMTTKRCEKFEKSKETPEVKHLTRFK